MSKALLVLLVMAGCTEVVPSQPEPDLSCVGRLEAIVPGELDDGIVLDQIGGSPIANAYVEVLGDRWLGEALTDLDGRYEMPTLSSGRVVRHGVARGYLDAYAYDPMQDGKLLPLPMVTALDLDRVAQLAGVAIDATKANMLVLVQDCAARRIEGATVSAPGADAIVYVGDDTHFDPALAATTAGSAALLLNVPLGEIALDVEVAGASFRPLTIETYGNALVTAWRRP